MRFRSSTAAAALAIAAMTVGAGTAHAEPGAPADPGVKYSIKLVDKTVVASLRGGTFSIGEQAGPTPDAPKTTLVHIADSRGATVLSLPLDYQINGIGVPLQAIAQRDNTVLEISPKLPAGASVPERPLDVKPIASDAENKAAMSDVLDKLRFASEVGAFVGAAIGFVIGCVVGLLAGCIPGATIGGVVGTIVAGGPTLIAAGIDLIQTMQAAPGTTRWAPNQPTAQPTPAPTPPN